MENLINKTQENAHEIFDLTKSADIFQTLDVENLDCLGNPQARNVDEAILIDQLYKLQPSDIDSRSAQPAA